MKNLIISETELGGSNKSARELLNDTINKWEDGLGNNLFISGTNKPDLADLVIYLRTPKASRL